MNLVEQAYEQYECFKKNKPFVLTDQYILISTLEANGRPFGFVARDFNNTYVVFRGTSSWQDLLIDASADLVDHPLGMVHEGGYKLYEQMWESLKGCMKPGHKLVIMGHSLGCWPATLAAVDLSHYSPTVHLYGSPRVGDIAFARNFNKIITKATRYVNSEDIATTLPFPNVYCHIGSVESFTVHTGDLIENHRMSLYAEHCD